MHEKYAHTTAASSQRESKNYETIAAKEENTQTIAVKCCVYTSETPFASAFFSRSHFPVGIRLAGCWRNKSQLIYVMQWSLLFLLRSMHLLGVSCRTHFILIEWKHERKFVNCSDLSPANAACDMAARSENTRVLGPVGGRWAAKPSLCIWTSFFFFFSKVELWFEIIAYVIWIWIEHIMPWLVTALRAKRHIWA